MRWIVSREHIKSNISRHRNVAGETLRVGGQFKTRTRLFYAVHTTAAEAMTTHAAIITPILTQF